MDVTNNMRGSNAKDIVTTLEVLGMIGETSATEGFFVKVVLLNHGTHGTVED